MFSLHCIHSISFFDKIIHNEVVFISHIKIPRISQQMQIFQIAATILFYAWIWIAWKLSLTSNAYAFRNTYLHTCPIYLSYVGRFLNIEKIYKVPFVTFLLIFNYNSIWIHLNFYSQKKKNRIYYHSIFQKLNNHPLRNLIPMNNHWLPFARYFNLIKLQVDKLHFFITIQQYINIGNGKSIDTRAFVLQCTLVSLCREIRLLWLSDLNRCTALFAEFHCKHGAQTGH